jgi:nucleoside-diphosphate-sugar epimerase
MLGESGFLNYSRKLGFEAVVVRYHNMYGPRMGFKHVIPHLAQRFIARETPFQIFGHEQTRAFNYIDDAVQGTVLAMEKGGNREIYHIGDTDEISIERLVRYVGELFGYGGPYELAATHAGSVRRRCPDITKASRDFGYTPNVQWQDGVRKTIEWYRGYLSSGAELSESYYDETN